MSTPKRRQPTSVIARLLAEPHKFGFMQAVRLLDRWFSQRDRAATGSDSVKPGLSKRLFFRNTLSLSFPASEIAELKTIEAASELLELAVQEASAAVTVSKSPVGSDAALNAVMDATEVAALVSGTLHEFSEVQRVEITPAFMSLLGSGGALPIFYTELLAERETYHRDTAARAFLDIFQHRAVSLFYDAWRKNRLAVQFENDRRNKFLPLVLSLAGTGQNALRERLHAKEGGVADDTLAYFSGILQHRPVSARVIQQMVTEYFRVPVQLDQFVGRWFTLPRDSSTSLGMANAVLGAGAVMGERVWQRDLRMRLTLGPMDREKFRRFLPGGTAALALRELLTMLTGVSLEYEIRLSLKAAEVQGMCLSKGTGQASGGALLGWDSFLTSHTQTRDRIDAGYDIHALA
jgi:type VI secretion system protein ImpH